MRFLLHRILRLYDVGFNHFFRALSETHCGDLVFPQGHSIPGIYARAHLEGRIDEEQLGRFRQEVDDRGTDFIFSQRNH